MAIELTAASGFKERIDRNEKLATTVFVPFFGPVQTNGAHTEIPTGVYAFPGAALSASTAKFFFQFPHKKAIFARWMLIWTPGTAAVTARLVYMDDGPSNIVQIVTIPGQTGGPFADGAVITDAFNFLVTQRVSKSFGIQFTGDNVQAYTMYKSGLELTLSDN